MTPILFRSIPAELMFRYNFVPLEAHDTTLMVAMADPSQLQLTDELSLLLGKRLQIRVATTSQIDDLLKRTEQSQRVLDQATEGFTLQVVGDDEDSEENISMDKLTRDSGVSPVVRLVDTVIFTALERRASDIHIETRNTEVVVKYRIDGVLQYAMQPLAKEWHATILSRIKVMSELDIAERRVPQDGRFRVRYKGRFVDFRVSIMPSVHGEDAVLARAGQRDAEREIPQPDAGRSRLRRAGQSAIPPLHSRAVRHGAGYRADRLGQDHHAVRRDQRNQERRRQDHHHRRSRSNIRCAASRRFP